MYREKKKKLLNLKPHRYIINLRVKVVQHNNVCSRASRLSPLLCWAALHLNLTAEARHTASLFNSLKNKEFMVINTLWGMISSTVPRIIQQNIHIYHTCTFYTVLRLRTVQARANYGSRAKYGLLSFLIWPAKRETMNKPHWCFRFWHFLPQWWLIHIFISIM